MPPQPFENIENIELKNPEYRPDEEGGLLVGERHELCPEWGDVKGEEGLGWRRIQIYIPL